MFQKKIFKICTTTLLLVILSITLGCSHSSSYSYKRTNSHQGFASNALTASPDKIWRPSKKNSVPYTSNDRVKKWITLFNGKLRPSFSKWIKRLGYYGPTISAVLKEEGVPQDLIYLAMIESGFNASAQSHASAVGTWQFISSTGKMYGLNNDFFTDDRCHIVQSTRAAARHLKDLHKVYNNWYLAFAAYNAGAGKVNRAIKRGRTKNYWRISSRRSRLLRQETKDYVPKILAAMHIVKHYKKYGYSEKSFASPMAYELVSVPDATDFKALAKSAKTHPHVIASLNPSLLLGITPPGKSYVYVPKGAADEFKRNYAMIPASKRVSTLQYKVGRNETVTSIAKKYKLSAKKIARTNKIKKTNKKLKPGMILKIPGDKGTLLTIAKLSANERNKSSGSSTKRLYYRVRPGDTLSHIARKYRTSTKKIAKWNKIKKTSRLRVGQKLKIYKKGSSGSRTSSGTFLAKYSAPKGRKKLSGVSHIIIQDANSGDTYTPKTQYSKTVKMPSTIAANESPLAMEMEDAVQPGIVKTITGKVIDTNQEAEESQPTQRTKPKYHVVKPGESLYAIAAKYKIRVSTLQEMNHLSSNMIRPKQKLLVSKGSKTRTVAHTTAKTVSKKTNTTYTVKPGDSLSVIAQKHHVRTKDLQNWNGLTSNNIKVGQKLKIQKTTTTIAKTTKVHQSNAVYTVKPGDSLSVIAQKHNVRTKDLQDWNGLTSNSIKAGQKLKILGSSKTVAQAKKSTSNKVIYHKIKAGETLWSLSKRYQVKISDIMKWNQLKDDQVKPNQKIKIIALKEKNTNQATM